MSATSFAARFYKAALSPALHAMALIPGGCRFQPTCSEYAALALAQHGPWRGVAMTAWRLLRCHPLARGGWDPVPPIASCTHTCRAASKGTIE